MFFTRSIPTFPVMQKATFVSKDCAHPLLLNVIALGSLFVAFHTAKMKGEALRKLAHTAVATSWQGMMLYSGPSDAGCGVQLVMTALLGQTYAMLSKNKHVRTTSQMFHSLGFYWARGCGMYETDPMNAIQIPSIYEEPEVKNQRWRVWVAHEIRLRSVLGH